MLIDSTYSLGLISQNPFRILGVAGNATKRQIITDVNKYKAFLKVGKEISGPYDFLDGLVAVNRSVKTLDSALKAIELLNDHLRYQLFWFVDAGPIDRIALNHIQTGNIQKAIDIWSKVVSVSSILNLVVVYLIQNNWKEACLNADQLFSNYPLDVCSLVDETLDLSTHELMRLFTSAIASDNYHVLELMYRSCLEMEDSSVFSQLWLDNIRHVLAIPYVEEAKHKLLTIKNIPEDEKENRYSYAKSELLQPLTSIYGYLGENSNEYISLNNQIVKIALQCAIDYYNGAEDPDSVARDVKDFVLIVTDTSMPNSVLRQRCKENYEILCEICSKFPPESVGYYHGLLKKILDNYHNEESTVQNAFTFVDRCFPYLMSIRTILGESDAYYQKICTRVAEEALESIITDYNRQSEFLHNAMKTGDNYQRSNIKEQIREMIKSAIIAMYYLKELGMEADFRQNRFNNNYEILVKLACNALVLEIYEAYGSLAYGCEKAKEEDLNKYLKKNGPDLRDEEGYYSSINSLIDCYNYHKTFPNGRYAALVNSKIERFEYLACTTEEALADFQMRYPSTECDIEAKREEILFKTCRTKEDFENYLSHYSTYKKEAENRIDDLTFERCCDRASYVDYLSSYPQGRHRYEAQYKVDDMDYKTCNTIKDLEWYLNSYPCGRHVSDARKRIEEENFGRNASIPILVSCIKNIVTDILTGNIKLKQNKRRITR